MKIGFLITDFSLGRGGERVAITLANLLGKQFDVQLISLYQQQPTPFFDIDPGIRVHVLHPPGETIHSSFFKKKQREITRLSRHIRNDNYALIIGVASYPSILLGCMKSIGAGAAKLAGWEHSNYEALSLPWKLIRKLFYRKLDALVCLTEEDRRLFNSSPRCIRVIPNSLSFTTAIKSSLKNNRVMAAGALEHEKGFDLLIRAFCPLAAAGHNWKLDIFGAGSQRPWLEKLISAGGAEATITIREPVKNIQEEMINSTIFVMPSRREGFGMVLIEAMECGVACISFDCPTGPRSIIEQGKTGVLVEPENVEKMTREMEALMTGPEKIKQLAANGSSAVGKYNSEVIADKWITLIHTLVN